MKGIVHFLRHGPDNAISQILQEPAVCLENVSRDSCAGVWTLFLLLLSGFLRFLPSVNGCLTDLSLICIRIEVKMARDSHHVDTSLARVILSFVLDAAGEGVDLLSFQVDLLAD